MHIEFGGDAHFEMWTRSIPAFRGALREHHPQAKVILVALPWAELTESGEPTPTSFGLSATEANKLYARYYDAATPMATEVIGRDLDDVRAADDHQWGTAPFHYPPRMGAKSAGPAIVSRHSSRINRPTQFGA